MLVFSSHHDSVQLRDRDNLEYDIFLVRVTRFEHATTASQTQSSTRLSYTRKFLVDNCAIMWNGPWHYKEMKLYNHSLKKIQARDKLKIDLFISNGFTVLVFEDRYFTPESAFELIKTMVPPRGFEPLLSTDTPYQDAA